MNNEVDLIETRYEITYKQDKCIKQYKLSDRFEDLDEAIEQAKFLDNTKYFSDVEIIKVEEIRNKVDWK